MPGKKEIEFKATKKDFLKSVTARITVAQVVERLRKDGSLSRDFFNALGIASIIAAYGLGENSAVFIICGLLLSPIMGPFLALSFGVRIRDKKLIAMAIKTILIGLLVCLINGFFFGLGFGDNKGTVKWPTLEMTRRGDAGNFNTGSITAGPSGAFMAMFMLGGNGASLVGVSISASILLPMVNCGLLWGFAARTSLGSLFEHSFVVYDVFNNTMNAALLPPENYTPLYHPMMNKECASLGGMSLILTFINMIFIIILPLIILKVKEISPKWSDESVSRFWMHDVKVARYYNKVLDENEKEDLGDQFLKEWKELDDNDPDTTNNEEYRLTQLQKLKDILKDAQEDDVYKLISIHTVMTAGNVVRRLIIKSEPCQFATPDTATRNRVIRSQEEDENDEHLPHIYDKPRSPVRNRPLQNPDSPHWPSTSKIQELSSFTESPVTEDDVSPLRNIRGARTRRRSNSPRRQQGEQMPSTHAPAQKRISADDKLESTVV